MCIVCGFVHVRMQHRQRPEEGDSSPEAGIKAAVNHLTWTLETTLGTTLEPSASTIRFPNH